MEGKKTYIAAAGLMIYAVLGLILNHVGGTEFGMGYDQAIQVFLNGFGLLGLRKAIAKK